MTSVCPPASPGRPVDPVADETLAAISALETQSEAVITRLDDIQKDLDGARKVRFGSDARLDWPGLMRSDGLGGACL